MRNYEGADGQLGLERTPEEYVARLVAIFREVRRVLRNDGVVWLNLGDSYAAARSYQVTDSKHRDVGNERGSTVPPGLKPGDLCGIPWRVAFALQADGWWLRKDNIWAKPNPMPESVNGWRWEDDRLRKGSWRTTSAHEYVFQLAKSADYFCDAEAVREVATEQGDTRHLRTDSRKGAESGCPDGGSRSRTGNPTTGRNPRSVWTITTKPSSEPHYAMMPEELAERCIRSSPSKVCAECGAPWAPVVERKSHSLPVDARHGRQAHNAPPQQSGYFWKPPTGAGLLGYRPTCPHDTEPAKALVLDPFSGMGTTGVVARRMGRRYVGADLSPYYARQSLLRLCHRTAGRVVKRMPAITGPLFAD